MRKTRPRACSSCTYVAHAQGVQHKPTDLKTLLRWIPRNDGHYAGQTGAAAVSAVPATGVLRAQGSPRPSHSCPLGLHTSPGGTERPPPSSRKSSAQSPPPPRHAYHPPPVHRPPIPRRPRHGGAHPYLPVGRLQVEHVHPAGRHGRPRVIVRGAPGRPATHPPPTAAVWATRRSSRRRRLAHLNAQHPRRELHIPPGERLEARLSQRVGHRLERGGGRVGKGRRRPPVRGGQARWGGAAAAAAVRGVGGVGGVGGGGGEVAAAVAGGGGAAAAVLASPLHRQTGATRGAPAARQPAAAAAAAGAPVQGEQTATSRRGEGGAAGGGAPPPADAAAEKAAAAAAAGAPRGGAGGGGGPRAGSRRPPRVAAVDSADTPGSSRRDAMAARAWKRGVRRLVNGSSSVTAGRKGGWSKKGGQRGGSPGRGGGREDSTPATTQGLRTRAER